MRGAARIQIALFYHLFFISLSIIHNMRHEESEKTENRFRYCNFCKKTSLSQHYDCESCNVHCNSMKQYKQHCGSNFHNEKLTKYAPCCFHRDLRQNIIVRQNQRDAQCVNCSCLRKELEKEKNYTVDLQKKVEELIQEIKEKELETEVDCAVMIMQQRRIEMNINSISTFFSRINN